MVKVEKASLHLFPLFLFHVALGIAVDTQHVFVVETFTKQEVDDEW